VGWRDRCSSSSGMGDGNALAGMLAAGCALTVTLGLEAVSSNEGWRTVDTLAVDEPETDDGGEDAASFSFAVSSRPAGYAWNSAASPFVRIGEPSKVGGLTLAANGLPVRSRPRSPSSLPNRPRPLLLLSPRPLTAGAPRASADPVGERLPMGELVPRLEREPDRSRSENDELRATERPRDSERESVERV